MPWLISENREIRIVHVISLKTGVLVKWQLWSNRRMTLSGQRDTAHWSQCLQLAHCDDVIMSTITSQITSPTVVYSTVYSDADQRKHQSSRHWPLCGPVNSPHKGPVTREMFPFDDVIILNEKWWLPGAVKKASSGSKEHWWPYYFVILFLGCVGCVCVCGGGGGGGGGVGGLGGGHSRRKRPIAVPRIHLNLCI